MREIAPYRVGLYFAAFLSITSALLGIVPLVAIHEILKGYLESVEGVWESTLFTQIIALALVAILVRYFLYYRAMRYSHKAAYGLHYDLRMKISAHLARLPLGFLTSKNSGELKKLMSDDVEIIEIFLGHYFPDLLASLTLPLVALIYLCGINPALALISALPLLIAFYSILALNRVYAENIDEYHDNFSKMNSIIVEYISGIGAIKIFSKARIYARFKEALERNFAIANRWTKHSAFPAAWLRISIDLVLLSVLAVGFLLYYQETLSLADFAIFILFSITLLEPINRLLMISNYLTRIFEGIANIRKLLDENPLAQAHTNSKPNGRGIEFKNVSFAYGEREVLHNISFTLSEDSHTYLIGASGAGKSTIASLLARFHDVKGGSITIGGVDIRALPNLMEYLSFVFQETFLLDDTVAQNIRVGKPSASKVEVVAAAKMAMADDFIRNLEHGYESNIGENGTFLSGGERQRISLARAFLKDSPILILDEASASIDPEIKESLYEIFEKLKEGKTTLSITHEYHRLKDDDRVILIDKGEVAFDGMYGRLRCLNLL